MQELARIDTPSRTQDFCLARQPILDRKGNTIAYELLFRKGSMQHAVDDRAATAHVIAHAFNELGLDSVLGGQRAFINFDAVMLMTDVIEFLPTGKVVIELLESVPITPAIVARCRDLKAQGFSLALDDVARIDPAHAPLMPLLDYVKVDVLKAPTDQLEAIMVEMARYKLKPIAEKVDNADMAARCEALGFELFQGYFYARPTVLNGKRTDPSKQIMLRLMHQLLTDADNHDIEQTFKQAPEMTYKLLRLVNSVGVSGNVKIQTLAQAILVLGRRQMQRWLQLLLFAQYSRGDFPSPLLTLSSTRGRLMEMLAESLACDKATREEAFMVGMFSLLDALLGEPLPALLDELALSDEIRLAILRQEGRLGALLRLIIAMEQDEGDEVDEVIADHPELAHVNLMNLQIEAMLWADSIAKSAR
jgi:EAL and modified HD-GYP domain-containing signal transduction protein